MLLCIYRQVDTLNNEGCKEEAHVDCLHGRQLTGSVAGWEDPAGGWSVGGRTLEGLGARCIVPANKGSKC